MNRQDILLISISLVLCFLILIIYMGINNEKVNKAYVYYDNKLVLTLDLNTSTLKEYNVDGYNGKVYIEVINNRVRVIKEKSPYHLCSKQGWVNSSLQMIVCLPNKVIIKLESSKSNDLDAIVR